MFDKLYNLPKNKELRDASLNQYKYYKYMFTTLGNSNRSYILSSDFSEKRLIRHEIVETLRETNFERTRWTTRSVVGFIHEVIYDLPDERLRTSEEDICRRYNVSANRLNSLVSTFINLKQSHYDLEHYFNEYELLYIKYRNPKTLSKNLAEGKVTDEEIQLLVEMHFLIYDDKTKTYKIA